jgi:hypothetical protein
MMMLLYAYRVVQITLPGRGAITITEQTLWVRKIPNHWLPSNQWPLNGGMSWNKMTMNCVKHDHHHRQDSQGFKNTVGMSRCGVDRRVVFLFAPGEKLWIYISTWISYRMYSCSDWSCFIIRFHFWLCLDLTSPRSYRSLAVSVHRYRICGANLISARVPLPPGMAAAISGLFWVGFKEGGHLSFRRHRHQVVVVVVVVRSPLWQFICLDMIKVSWGVV